MTEFHPEIINTNRPNHGAQLVHNFVDLALGTGPRTSRLKEPAA